MASINTNLSVDTSGAYSADPPSVTVTQKDTQLVYTLDKDSAQEWMITGLSTSDVMSQSSPYRSNVNGTAVSFVDCNTEAETFNVTVFVEHRSTHAKAKIDPEVINEPPG